MKATRTVPARPVNDTESVTRKIIDLVAETLGRSHHLDADGIRAELAVAEASLALLAVGGHLRRGDLVLAAPGLRLRIDVPVGEDALSATEYIEPPRGAANADRWTLHLPAPDALGPVVKAAGRSSPHVSLEPAPDEPPQQASSPASQIDLSRLATTRDRP